MSPIASLKMIRCLPQPMNVSEPQHMSHAPTEKDPMSPKEVVDLMSPSPYNPELYPDNQLGLESTSSAKTFPADCVSPVRETWAKVMVSQWYTQVGCYDSMS